MFKLSMGTFVLTGAALLANQAQSPAAISNPLDSSAFTYKYEGDAYTVDGNGVTGSGFGNTGYGGVLVAEGVSATSDGDILNYTTTEAFGGVLESSIWQGVATHEAGWTWESRFRVNSSVGQWAMLMRIGPAVNNSVETQHEVFRFTDTEVLALAHGSLTMAAPSGTFHTLRVAQAPGSSEFNVWLNGELKGAYTLADGQGPVGGVNPWLGDGSGNGGGNIDFDYIRFTAGGYSPVPEPAALSLLSLCALALIRRRK